MSNTGYLILGYVIAVGLLWGYAALLWWRWRSLKRAGLNQTENST